MTHATAAGLLAGIGLSQVRVYSTEAPDGQCSGTPHLHVACSELYFPLRGTGAAEFLTADGPQRVSLQPGAPVQFTPGTVHRLISGPDPLEILVIMENGHLNEHGDVVFAFPDEDLADAATYAKLAWTGPPEAPDMAAVERRRDRAVTGFTQRASAWQRDPGVGLAQLERLHELAVTLVAPAAARWPRLIARGPASAAAALAARAEAAAERDTRFLRQARVTQLTEYDDQKLTPRMCGHLWSYSHDGRAWSYDGEDATAS